MTRHDKSWKGVRLHTHTIKQASKKEKLLLINSTHLLTRAKNGVHTTLKCRLTFAFIQLGKLIKVTGPAKWL